LFNQDKQTIPAATEILTIFIPYYDEGRTRGISDKDNMRGLRLIPIFLQVYIFLIFLKG